MVHRVAVNVKWVNVFENFDIALSKRKPLTNSFTSSYSF